MSKDRIKAYLGKKKNERYFIDGSVFSYRIIFLAVIRGRGWISGSSNKTDVPFKVGAFLNSPNKN